MTRKTVLRIAGIRRHQAFLFLHSDIFPSSLLYQIPPNPKVLVTYGVIIKINIHVKTLSHDWLF
jgi:hypothetical protein